jgi:hypothetical protein
MHWQTRVVSEWHVQQWLHVALPSLYLGPKGARKSRTGRCVAMPEELGPA